MRVNAGYRIIKSIDFGEYEIVLGKRNDGRSVTWQHTKTGGYFWGHYFENDLIAEDDFWTRVKESAEIRIRQRGVA